MTVRLSAHIWFGSFDGPVPHGKADRSCSTALSPLRSEPCDIIAVIDDINSLSLCSGQVRLRTLDVTLLFYAAYRTRLCRQMTASAHAVGACRRPSGDPSTGARDAGQLLAVAGLHAFLRPRLSAQGVHYPSDIDCGGHDRSGRGIGSVRAATPPGFLFLARARYRAARVTVAWPSAAYTN